MNVYTQEVDNKVQNSINGLTHFDFSSIFKDAWELTKKTIGVYIGILIIGIVIGFGVVMILGISSMGMFDFLLGNGIFSLQFILFSLVSGLLIPMLLNPLSVGVIAVSYFEDKHNTGEIGQILYGYKDFAQLALAYIIFHLPLILIELGLSSLGWTALPQVISLIASVFYWFVAPLIVFKKFNYLTAIKCSMSIASKYFIKLIAVIIVVILINILGTLSLLFGLLISLPFSFCITYIVIRNLILDDEKAELQLDDNLLIS